MCRKAKQTKLLSRTRLFSNSKKYESFTSQHSKAMWSSHKSCNTVLFKPTFFSDRVYELLYFCCCCCFVVVLFVCLFVCFLVPSREEWRVLTRVQVAHLHYYVKPVLSCDCNCIFFWLFIHLIFIKFSF